MRQRIADAGPEIQNLTGLGQAGVIPQMADDFDLVPSEIVRGLAADREILLMRRQVVLGEFVELGSVQGWFHRSNPGTDDSCGAVTSSIMKSGRPLTCL